MKINLRHGCLGLTLLVLMAGYFAGYAEMANAAGNLKISNRFSPMNRYRDNRGRTDYIILHTTEGGDRSSLRRVRQRGLAHYLVLRDGRIHRVIKRKKVALHAGRSMWNGVQNLDRRTIGIEVVGYHNKPITQKQITALAELLSQLQKIYSIPDEKVLTHSMIAYGKPNRWHNKNHRGRKRCGMQFADPELRRKLGLDKRPLFDPDVKAGRLINADPYLASVLYMPDDSPAQKRDPAPSSDNIITARRSAWYIAREEYDDATTVYVFPSGKRKRGDQISNWSKIPKGTRVLVNQVAASPVKATPQKGYLTLARNQAASKVAGKAYDDYATVYVYPGGKVRRGDTLSEGDFRGLPPGTRIFLGYELAGKITRNTTAYKLCGQLFNRASTVYLLPDGRVKNGDSIREKSIPTGTRVLVKS